MKSNPEVSSRFVTRLSCLIFLCLIKEKFIIKVQLFVTKFEVEGEDVFANKKPID